MSAVLRALVVALALPACGTAPDARPPTLDVITYEVLAPTCGQVQCHSTTAKIKGWALDTLDGTRAAMPELLEPGRHNDTGPQLLYVIDTKSNDIMPPDTPLSSEDIALIHAWYDGGKQGL